MTVYEAVVSRLAMLGYTVTDNDETGLNFLILVLSCGTYTAHEERLASRTLIGGHPFV